MWKFIHRARGRIRPARIRYSKLGVTGGLSLVALIIIFVAGALLDLRGDDAAVRRFGEFVRANQKNPVDAVVEAAGAHRFVFLADIYNAEEPKKWAGDVIQALATGPGLDAVLVEVGHDQQPYLDRYFDVTPEDASVLLGHPRVIHEPSPASRAYLDLYHRIWVLNQRLGADRRIKVVAADLDAWPDERALSPTVRSRRFGERTRAMMTNLDQEVLSKNSRARVLVFMAGLHALRAGYGHLQTGGTAPVEVHWFAAQLQRRFPGEVMSVLMEATGGGSTDELIQYQGTRLPELAENALPSGRYALGISQAFDFLSAPINAQSLPGITFDIFPRDYKLRDVADVYVHLGH